MAAVNGNEYDHVDFTKNGITTRHLLKDTNARKDIGEVFSMDITPNGVETYDFAVNLPAFDTITFAMVCSGTLTLLSSQTVNYYYDDPNLGPVHFGSFVWGTSGTKWIMQETRTFPINRISITCYTSGTGSVTLMAAYGLKGEDLYRKFITDDLVSEVAVLDNDVSYATKSIEMASVDHRAALPFSFAGNYGYVNYQTGETVNIYPSMHNGFDEYAYTNKVIVAGLSKIFYKNIEFVDTPSIELVDSSNPDEIGLEPIYNTGMAFYTKDDTYIRGVSTTINSNNEFDRYNPDLREEPVPSNAVYARFTIFKHTETYGSFNVYGITLSGELQGRVTALEESVEDVNDALNEDVLYATNAATKISKITRSTLSTSRENYGYINSSTRGTIMDIDPSEYGGFNKYSYTGKVDVSGLSKIFYTNLECKGTPNIRYTDPTTGQTRMRSMQNPGMAFYTKNNSFIIGNGVTKNASADGYGSEYTTLTVPNNAAYARFTIYSDTSTYGSMNVQGITATGELKERLDVIENSATTFTDGGSYLVINISSGNM